ncbi:hypothetical protein KAS08_01765 [Candidatus Pacearchaeota archaeon]|nr:hypothetical protein [Candidatus Pacearchaeota archaeon]
MASKVTVILITLVYIFAFAFLVRADPTGPDSIVRGTNETWSGSTSGEMVNISGGYIAKMNITSTQQNSRWKAFLGNVVGKFTLNDGSGATIYDWSSASVAGEVLASRNSTSIDWSSIGCASTANMEAENTALGHFGSDNITATFNKTGGNYQIAGQAANNCPATNPYVNNNTQDTAFQEIVLSVGGDIVYAANINATATGYDGNTYDFQMIVPEGTAAGNTPYYLYVELD